jgi:hypothetical protein
MAGIEYGVGCPSEPLSAYQQNNRVRADPCLGQPSQPVLPGLMSRQPPSRGAGHSRHRNRFFYVLRE